MADMALFSNRNTGQKCRAIALAITGAAPLTTIPDPRAETGALNTEIFYAWDLFKFRTNANQAPKDGDYIVAFNDMPNYLVTKKDFEDNWHLSGDFAVPGSVGSVTNDPDATGSGGTGTTKGSP